MQALETGQTLLQQLREMQAVGRLVIDLEELAARVSGAEIVNDVELRDGDRLLVPKKAQEVTCDAARGRYVLVRILSEVNGNPWASIAELGIIGK